jgi:chromosome segregation ATPase
MIDKINDLWFKYNNEVLHKSTFVSNESIFKKLLTEFVENYEIIINDFESECLKLEYELDEREDDLNKKDEIINELEYKIENLESTIDELRCEIVVLEHNLQTLSDELYNN